MSLSPEAVSRRLQELREVYVPMTAEEARRAMEPPSEGTSLQPQAVRARLDELRALVELADALHRSRIPQ